MVCIGSRAQVTSPSADGAIGGTTEIFLRGMPSIQRIEYARQPPPDQRAGHRVPGNPPPITSDGGTQLGRAIQLLEPEAIQRKRMWSRLGQPRASASGQSGGGRAQRSPCRSSSAGGSVATVGRADQVIVDSSGDAICTGAGRNMFEMSELAGQGQRNVHRVRVE